MSYILEALKKSEQQREIGRVPGITSVHEKTAKSVSGKWYWLIAAILLLNAGLLVLLLWPETEREPEPEQVATSMPLQEAVPPRRDRPVSPSLGQPTAAEKPVPRVSQTASSEPPPEPPAAEVVKSRRAAKPLPEETVIAAAVLPTTPQIEQSQVEQPPAPTVKADVPDLPVWPQIPSHLFQQLGSNLRLDVHVFSDQPEKSFVLINMRKYRAGEKLQEGPQLDEVTAEGVILSFRGQRFRLQAQ